jgi:hypothetical protein
MNEHWPKAVILYCHVTLALNRATPELFQLNSSTMSCGRPDTNCIDTTDIWSLNSAQLSIFLTIRVVGLWVGSDKFTTMRPTTYLVGQIRHPYPSSIIKEGLLARVTDLFYNGCNVSNTDPPFVRPIPHVITRRGSLSTLLEKDRVKIKYVVVFFFLVQFAAQVPTRPVRKKHH